MIKRSIDAERFSKVQQDFGFLIERIHKEHGELDLRLRNNYFNLYYKGNSMAKVAVKDGCYEVSTHAKFANASCDGAPSQEEGYYDVRSVPAEKKILKSHFTGIP